MSDQHWINDGHLVEVGTMEEDRFEMRIICPPHDPEKGCGGPFEACAECEGSGMVYPDGGDETECPDCHETGWSDGVHSCYLKLDYSGSLRDDVREQATEPGTYTLLYRTEGHYEDFEMFARIDPFVEVPDVPSSRAS